MARLGDVRPALLEALDRRYGPLPSTRSGDFGGETFFESIARVVLGLLIEPRRAAAALAVIRDASLLEPAALAAADPADIDELLRQNHIKLTSRALKPLRKLAGWAAERDAESIAGLSTEALREEWRSLSGVGPASADALLLFALGRPTYPVDRASYRVMVRHGWLDPSSDYDEARSVLEGFAPDDPGLLALLSGWMEKVGRDACKPGSPQCDRCPLREFLPEGGPIEES